MNRTDTAHLDWEERWKTEEGRKRWLEPEADVKDMVPMLQERQVQSILDLGCGIGRHSLFFAERGFHVHAMDGSPSGISFLRDQAEAKQLRIESRHAEMTEIPHDANSMDYVLAWNVIYHGDLTVIHRVLAEILRVLKPKGLFQGTMLSKRHSAYGTGKRVAKNTYVKEDVSDKNHPHFYCNAAEIINLFCGFELWWLKDIKHSGELSYHWHFLAEKI